MILPGIRAVTFDVGNTLIEPRVSVGQVYAEVAARHGYDGLSSVELNTRFQAAFQANGSLVNTGEEWARIVDVTFAGLTDRPPSETFFPELFERFSQPAAWRIYDDVQPALGELSRDGLRLGVISNWDERLRPLLAALNLATHFEVIVISCEAGMAKPARGIFDQAAGQFRLPAAALLHVGDGWDADVLGARAAGLHSLQIVRGQPADADRIGSLREIIGRVGCGQ